MPTGLVQFNNLGDLIQSIALYLDVDPTDTNDPTTQAIPGFVQLAEATIGRRLRAQENLARATATLDNPEELLPADFGSIRRLVVGQGANYTVLTYLRPDIAAQVPDTGELGIYTILAGRVQMHPGNTEFYTSADPPLELRMVYFSRPRLTDLTSTNAVLYYHPDIYLYGSLLAAGSFVIDTARQQLWATLYDSAIESANLSYDESHSTMFMAPVLGP